jgi:ABC-type uncharacterized transport system involved in gliding motility auxiliary subunit
MRIDDDIRLLWIVHPAGLSENALYAIDQFLLAGGRALIFVDPLAEIAGMTTDPAGLGGDTSSSLEPLFAAWGLRFDPTLVVADNEYGLSVQLGAGRIARHIGLLGLDADAMAADDVVTAGLDAGINIGTAGSLTTADDAGITLVPLLQSSSDSTLLPAAQFQFLSDPLSLLDAFVPDADRYVLAGRIEGPLTTAFPDGPPTADAASSEDDTPPAIPDSHIASSENSNVVVVADVDILSDRLWVQRQRGLLGGEVVSAIANNGDFVANAVANLAGSEKLIGLKSRQTFIRPFDRVEDLQREADARFREREQELQARLADTEARLGELQQAREDQGSIFMSPEQEQELDRFQQEQLRIRQDLRSVQRELDSSIDNLGTSLKLINIFLIPLGLAIFALAGWLLRRPRRGKAGR